MRRMRRGERRPGPAERETLDRIVAFVRHKMDRSSTRTEAFRWGTAVFNEDFPRSYVHNCVRIERTDDLTVDGLIDEADRVLGGAGLDHRLVAVEDGPTGALLAPGLREAGWWIGHGEVMVLRRPPDRPAPDGTAREVSWQEMRPAKERMARAEPYATDDETVRQLVDRRDATAQAVTVRHFAAFDGDRAVSIADLYQDGDVAQIEDVWTEPAYRGRGLARATVLAAAEAAKPDADLVFLNADVDDWPKKLYAKLGFDVVGFEYDFIRWPAGLSPQP
ncbi:MAG TPA: GNAT family N-acetyltransferase [Actinomycetota bacterium]